MMVGTKENFEKEVLKSDVPVMVEFWAPWCGPCKMMMPIVEKLGEDAKYKDKVKFVKVNIDEQPDVAGQFNVMSIPTLFIFKGGKPADAHVGAMSEGDLHAWLEKNL